MRSNPQRGRRLPRLALLLITVVLAGCGQAAPSNPPASAASSQAAPASTAGTQASKYPVTITSCGASATFDSPPKRVVTTDVNMVEDMLALGLDSTIVGTFTVGDNTHKIGPRYRAAWDKLTHVSDKYPDNLEAIVAVKPDFIFTGWSWGMSQSKNITPETLATYGIKTYSLAESCDYAPGGTSQTQLSLETDTYVDLLNLGKIFGVQPKAEQVVNDMKSRIAAVQARVKSTTPKTVFLHDAGDAAPGTAAGLAIPTALITLAGGANIFADDKRSWTRSTWEAVVAAKPDCIILNDYGGTTASTTAVWKENFLKTSPITMNLPAVKNNCILTLNFEAITSGPDNAEAVEAIARWLHPEAFK